MAYKTERWIIKKEDLICNPIVCKYIFLKKVNTSIIKGTVVDEYSIPIQGCAVILMEIDELIDLKICRGIVYTDEEGIYYMTIIPKENKLYSIEVYKNIDTVYNIKGGIINGNI